MESPPSVDSPPILTQQSRTKVTGQKASSLQPALWAQSQDPKSHPCPGSGNCEYVPLHDEMEPGGIELRVLHWGDRGGTRKAGGSEVKEEV